MADKCTRHAVNGLPIMDADIHEVSWLYHSESWQEIDVKVAALGKKLSLDFYRQIYSMLTYHYAFWQHTRPRFRAWLKWLKLRGKNDKLIKDGSVLREARFQLARYEENTVNMPGLFLVPGDISRIKAWKKLIEVLEKLAEPAKAEK